jgi:hypothetical protein
MKYRTVAFLTLSLLTAFLYGHDFYSRSCQPIDHCPKITGPARTWNSEQMEFSLLASPLRFLCVFPTPTITVLGTGGDPIDTQAILNDINISFPSGYIRSRLPWNNTVVQVQMQCLSITWCCDVAHIVTTNRRLDEPVPVLRKKLELPKEPQPSALAYFLGALILFVVYIVFLVFCCWWMVCLLAICCAGALAQRVHGKVEL